MVCKTNIIGNKGFADLFPIPPQPRQNLIRAIGETILHSGAMRVAM
jgi:hypothetical protein